MLAFDREKSRMRDAFDCHAGNRNHCEVPSCCEEDCNELAERSGHWYKATGKKILRRTECHLSRTSEQLRGVSSMYLMES